eukprot:CAMPEP_0198237578 /NCGR_PEP_ID=MMETSP1446-20131203/3366_1 /TAXON_ID=1461542 ORGANISM="Unidentified sp, Strain CCMP2111" /NCGR_SAMPLE_ID=MMETSP1446 /ASSEMBLY_ACC=CAM_ASM_001112 /LENGTH=290 /DNA_ID=CAMNT_0043919747 /DNA_START=66 /DNA_END=939 /DNA_ORIENTATION=-
MGIGQEPGKAGWGDADADAAQTSDWVEVGVIVGAHGVRGEVRVKPFTDASEQRFRPGQKSWIQRQASPLEAQADPEQIEIVGVRRATSRSEESLLVRLEDIASRTDAEALKGLVFLVKANEREALDGDSEFYAQELIGLQVRMKDDRTGNRGGSGSGSARANGGESFVRVGRVVDVYEGMGTHNSLDVALCESFLASHLNLSEDEDTVVGASGKSGNDGAGEEQRGTKSSKTGAKRRSRRRTRRKGAKASGSKYVLVPFAREMVPVVSLQEGFLEIDPPEGLIEACIYTK